MHKSVSLGVGTTAVYGKEMLNILNSDKFSNICNSLLGVWSDYIEIYTDGSLKNAGSVEVAAICKGFVLRNWYAEAVLVFEKKEKAALVLVEYIRFVIELHYTRVWIVRAKHRVNMEKTGLIGDNNMISDLFHCMVSMLSIGVVYMFGVMESFAVRFSRCKLCYFFSSLDGDVFVSIDV
ncbi:hypothetical protein G9A89_024006 [Geosiphon pyriformis]|nr:hypothetical protein G9A89_024006 [Geosiphon pyriformis]